jgi:hypothetical protein
MYQCDAEYAVKSRKSRKNVLLGMREVSMYLSKLGSFT